MKDDTIEGDPRGSDDTMLLDHHDLPTAYTLLQPNLATPSPSPVKRVQANDLKVTPPITPANTMRLVEGERQSLSFADEQIQVIPEQTGPAIPNLQIGDADADLDKLFIDLMQPSAMIANESLNNEQLQEADALYRIEPLKLEWSMETDPPWKTLLTAISRDELRKAHWHGQSKIERTLPWNPFPRRDLANIAPFEEIANNTTPTALLKTVHAGEIAQLSSLTWKPEGLRILDHQDEDDDEPLEVAAQYAESVDTLVRKRKDTYSPGRVPKNKQAGMYDMYVPLMNALGKMSTDNAAPERTSTSARSAGSVIAAHLFSAENALEKFMESQGRASKKPRLSSGHELAYNATRHSAKDEHSIQDPEQLSQADERSLQRKENSKTRCLCRTLQQIYPAGRLSCLQPCSSDVICCGRSSACIKEHGLSSEISRENRLPRITRNQL